MRYANGVVRSIRLNQWTLELRPLSSILSRARVPMAAPFFRAREEWWKPSFAVRSRPALLLEMEALPNPAGVVLSRQIFWLSLRSLRPKLPFLFKLVPL